MCSCDSRSGVCMPNILESEGGDSCDLRTGWVASICFRREVGNGASVDMYNAERESPCGGGS